MNKKTFLAALLLIFGFWICLNAQNNRFNYEYESVKIDSTFDKDADLTIETYISHLKKDKDKVMERPVGVSAALLRSFSPASPLSNLLVDILFEWGNEYMLSKKMPKPDLALLNFGGIRATLPQGKITVGDIYEILPYDNTVAFVSLKGSELAKMFAGFSEKSNAPLANVQTIYQNGRLLSFTVGGASLDENKTYVIVTVNFLAQGGDGFLNEVKIESVVDINMQVRDVVLEEIRKKTAQGIEIKELTDDRVIIKSTP